VETKEDSAAEGLVVGTEVDLAARAGADLVETEVGLAETEAGLAETEVGLAETEVGLAETEVGLAETEVGLAETEVGLAETEVDLALEIAKVAVAVPDSAKTTMILAMPGKGVRRRSRHRWMMMTTGSSEPNQRIPDKPLQVNAYGGFCKLLNKANAKRWLVKARPRPYWFGPNTEFVCRRQL